MKDRRKKCIVEGCSNYRHYSGKCKEHFNRNTWRGHPFHNAWENMKARCKPTFKQANNYFELDIKYVTRWELFQNFYQDMWESWKEGLTLDRINNNEGYSPENCRWATHAEQQRNRSVSKLSLEQAEAIRKRYLEGGITQAQLAYDYGVGYHVIADLFRKDRGTYAS